jgi:hypothetical protein
MRLLRGATCFALMTASAMTPLLLLAARCIDWRSENDLTAIKHPATRRAAGAVKRQVSKTRQRLRPGTRSGESRRT